MKVTNTYDNLDRLAARHNAFGLVAGMGYDHRDRVIASTNSSGVWFTNQFDHLSRVLVRGHPSGGKEQWGYTLGFAEARSAWVLFLSRESMSRPGVVVNVTVAVRCLW